MRGSETDYELFDCLCRLLLEKDSEPSVLNSYLSKYYQMEACAKKNIMICKRCTSALSGVTLMANEGDYQVQCFETGSITKNPEVRYYDKVIFLDVRPLCYTYP